MMKIDAYNFTIYDVETIHQDIKAEIESHDVVEIDMTHVEKIDMAALQLLISAKRSCKEENKAFSLTHVSDEVATAIRISGLECELGV